MVHRPSVLFMPVPSWWRPLLTWCQRAVICEAAAAGGVGSIHHHCDDVGAEVAGCRLAGDEGVAGKVVDDVAWVGPDGHNVAACVLVHAEPSTLDHHPAV